MGDTNFTKLQLENKTFTGKNGYEFKVIKYINSLNVIIQFTDDRHIQTETSEAVRKGKVVNIYDPNVCGVGYFGDGNYLSKVDSKPSPIYKCWNVMLDSYYKPRSKNYMKKQVCKEWLDFQNFAQWYDLNYYEIENERMTLVNSDSDIFSPETCFIIPMKLRGLFYENSLKRDLPQGVFIDKNRPNRYRAGLTRIIDLNGDESKFVNLGTFDTPELAFYAYENAKKEYAHYCADFYKDYIPYRLYNYLYDLEVKMY